MAFRTNIPRTAAANEALDLVDRKPEDSHHAVFQLPKELAVLGLGDWVSRLMQFLSHYDGIERLMDPRESEPVIFTRQVVLAEILQLNGGGEVFDSQAIKRRIAKALSEAAFTGVGAYWRLETQRDDLPKRIPWNPLKQKWLDFLDDAPLEYDQYWLSILNPSAYCAPPADIMRFLLE